MLHLLVFVAKVSEVLHFRRGSVAFVLFLAFSSKLIMELDTNFKNKIDALLEGYKLSEFKEVSFSIIDQYKKEAKEHTVINN